MTTRPVPEPPPVAPQAPPVAGGAATAAGPPLRSGPARPRPVARKLLLVPAVALVLGLLASLLVGPHAPSMRGESGDAALAARARAVVTDDRGYQSLALVEVVGDTVTHAGLGGPDADHPQVTPTTHLQLGSITKTWNGLLLADAVQRGEVRLDQPVGELLPELAGSPAGEVTLVELAQHRGGFPAMPPSEGVLMPAMWVSGHDPFEMGVPELLAEVRATPLQGRGAHIYSNVGASLLGHALARGAKAPDWSALVRARLFDPLGMRDTVIATSPELVPADGVAGLRANGQPLDPWTSPAMAPAGSSTWTTPEDMGRYARALLDGRAPGMSALDPLVEATSVDRIGLHWFTRDYYGHVLTWHNGGTQSASTMLVLDRQADRAMMVFSTTGRGPETLARQLVTDRHIADTPAFGTPENVIGLAVLATWLVILGQLAYAALRGRGLTGVWAGGLDMVTMTLLAVRLGPWQWVPGAVLGAGVGLAAGLLVVGHLRGLPMVGANRAAAFVRLGLSAALCVAIVVVALAVP